MFRFYLFEEDYKVKDEPVAKESFRIEQGTSVRAYKAWFLNCLKELGKVELLKDRRDIKRLRYLLSQPRAIFVSVHGQFDNEVENRVAHRHLWLTLGSLLLPQHFYNISHHQLSQVNLVSTKFQLERITSAIGNLAPKTFVFSNLLNTKQFFLPTHKQAASARFRNGITREQIHIVYAGRLILTKGICQLIRALDLWPMPQNILLTLVGNIDEDSSLVYSEARHKTFKYFFNEEVLKKKKRSWLRFRSAKKGNEFRELLWSADLFINPSIHPIEDFGVTPRQALLCGVPVLTTDFCGLQPVAKEMPWGGIHSYPTLFGLRFSLKEMRALLQKACHLRKQLAGIDAREIVLNESSEAILKENLKKAVIWLGQRPPETSLPCEQNERNIKRQFFANVDSCSLQYLKRLQGGISHYGFVYGDASDNYSFPVIQGVYSALSSPPQVQTKSKWAGFFRIRLCHSEMALIEFGYPGLRMRRYSPQEWKMLLKCVYSHNKSEPIFIAKEKSQCHFLQELVDFGYLVPLEQVKY